jgi:hypothetical protein
MKDKLLFAFLITVCFGGCYYDNFDEVHPIITRCDTTGTITYDSDIRNIFSGSCGSGDVSCHKTGNAADVNLDNFFDARDLATNGDLMGSILHLSGYKPMPSGGGSLSDCDIQKVQAWVNRDEPQ